jgi:hypothetical protein
MSFSLQQADFQKFEESLHKFEDEYGFDVDVNEVRERSSIDWCGARMTLRRGMCTHASLRVHCVCVCLRVSA